MSYRHKYPPEPVSVSEVAGVRQSGRDWSQDLAKLQNLDTALSSRASESTLSAVAGALASKATDKLRVSVVDALPRSPFTLYDSAGAELSGYVKNLDVALSVLARLINFNRNVTPAWVYGSEVTAPAAGTALVSRSVSSGRSGYIYGFIITAGEANDFKLSWVSGGFARGLRVTLASRGSVVLVSPVPVN